MSKYILNYGPNYKTQDSNYEKDFVGLLDKKNIWISNALLPEKRLGWIDTPNTYNRYLKLCKTTFNKIVSRNPSSIVFIGMGGSIQTGKVLDQIFSKNNYKLLFLDSTNPQEVNFIKEKIQIHDTFFVFMSKSGSTLETNNIMNFFIKCFNIEGESNFGKNFIAITDKNTPLEKFAITNSFEDIIITPEDVGGRFSSSTPFGLFPKLFMDSYAHANEIFDLKGVYDKSSLLTKFLIHIAQKNNILEIIVPKELDQMGTWIEQLIAETSGKDGKGIIPIIRNINNNSDSSYIEILTTETENNLNSKNVYLNIEFDKNTIFEDMYIWQIAVSILCKHVFVFPFDEPDVKKSKSNTEAILNGKTNIKDLKIPYSKVPIKKMINTNKSKQILYINMYLTESENIKKSLDNFLDFLSLSNNFKIVYGFGPRYLHSTGQIQKGGSKNSWFMYFYDNNLFDSNDEDEIYSELNDTFKSQLLGDYNAIKDSGRDAYLLGINSNKSNPFDEIMDELKEE